MGDPLKSMIGGTPISRNLHIEIFAKKVKERVSSRGSKDPMIRLGIVLQIVRRNGFVYSEGVLTVVPRGQDCSEGTGPGPRKDR